ncbi:MAG: hypothetical protein NT128_07650, partial [Proteobacteria bacterium]|nr:hypothetical protein [Pseudomonadota bacterium]
VDENYAAQKLVLANNNSLAINNENAKTVKQIEKEYRDGLEVEYYGRSKHKNSFTGVRPSIVGSVC